jgi:hypothetical protein
MECPVCYESEACCKFTCGHSFCKDCTKTWYMKGKSSCPMCRASMCFKGITKMKKLWYREKREETYVNLVNHMFNELMEDYSDIVLQCLAAVQYRYRYTICKYPTISCDQLDLVMRMVWVNIDYMLNTPPYIFYEPKTFEKYLMISKYGSIKSFRNFYISNLL